ncbi:MAG TPA: kelch repeat-containing protein [Pyrinomonadaceae bacterium]|nr:kelch repeat-containing protein [Pyrinomonadaceae bacterium]
MNDKGWQQVDKVFQAAVELDAARRAEFLNVACGDDQSLRAEVESLLTADSQSWNILDTPVLASAAILLDEGTGLGPGDEVGHYEILKLLGKGGMGEVYLARDRKLNRNIALKLLPFYYTQNYDRVRRFQREAQAASALNHPNIITIYELGSADDRQFIATEFIEGETLRERVSAGPLPQTEAIGIAMQTASALGTAHQAGIVHRDIKPENIMLRPDGYVKVLDFGLAKLAEHFEPQPQAAGADEADISSGVLMGTLRYMSPEQASGSVVDARSDIFSLGVVLYEMIAGQPPFQNKNVAQLLESILNDEPPPLAGFSNQAVPGLAAITFKALEKEPGNRYQDARDLLLDLRLVKDKLDHGAKFSKSESGRFSHLGSIRTIGSAAALIAILSVIVFIGIALNNSPPQTSAVSAGDPDSLSGGSWTSKAPISSARYQVEPAVLTDRVFFVGGWNLCTPFANMESYDPTLGGGWVQHAPMLTARGGHGVGVLHGLLYAVGGTVDCGGVNTRSVEAYDPALNSWSPRTSLPTERTGHVVAVANGRLYAIGGQSDGATATSLNTEYDPALDQWTSRAPMPTARTASAVTVLNEIIYVIGGSFGHRPLATVEAYDSRSDSWTIRKQMRSPRAFHAAAAVGGLIYAFGGSDSDEVEVYDPATDTWELAARMPERRAQIHAIAFEGSIYFGGGSSGGDYLSSMVAFRPTPVAKPSPERCPTVEAETTAPMPTERGAMAVGEINGLIYVVGGYDRNSRSLPSNDAYDPVADRWASKSSMPTAREVAGTNTAVVDGKLYVIGGNARGYCSNANEAYDAATDTWASRTPMPTARCHSAVVAHNGLIYVFGGTNTNGSIRYSALEIYDPSTDAWKTGAPMPTGRNFAGAAVLGGVIHVIGGWNPALTPDGSLDVVEAYDPATDKWAKRSPLLQARFALSADIVNGSLIVVGGEANRTSVTTIEAYDPVTDSWSTLANLSNGRVFHSAVALNNTLHIFGGRTAPYIAEPVATTEALNIARCPDPN